jgi:hypothetical protein
MIKFIIVAELKLNNDEYKVVESWGVEPTDYISTQIAEHMREKGMIIKVWSKEVDHSSYARLKEDAESYAVRDAMEELENEITSRACIGGVCED